MRKLLTIVRRLLSVYRLPRIVKLKDSEDNQEHKPINPYTAIFQPHHLGRHHEQVNIGKITVILVVADHWDYPLHGEHTHHP